MSIVSEIADELIPELNSFYAVGGDVSSLSSGLLKFDSKSESQSRVTELSVLWRGQRGKGPLHCAQTVRGRGKELSSL